MARIDTLTHFLTDVADAIRAKKGTVGTISASEFDTEIESISSTPIIESLSVTANGTYTAPSGTDGYSPITVNVPNPSTGSISITQNGTFNVTDYASAIVNVSGGGGGNTIITRGSFTIIGDGTASETIEHGLGHVPTMLFVATATSTSSATEIVQGSYYVPFFGDSNLQNATWKSQYSGRFRRGDYITNFENVDEDFFDFKSPLIANATYYWVAIYTDATITN